ncbi:MAG TPA: DUF1732 domain-containing protein [Polyangiaceae bacterium]|nr:DUF1732 domain-containing protein [Polyangiaceae bacterium]
MTGFGKGAHALGAGRIVVEARTVNGRFLDVRVRVPPELGELGSFVEGEARRRLSRGRCDIAVRTEGNVFPPPVLDQDRARSAYRSLVDLSRELTPGARVPFSMLSSVPDLFSPAAARNFDDAKAAIAAALSASLDDLERMRAREGAALAKDLTLRLAIASGLIERIAQLGPGLAATQAEKFRERLARIARLLSEGLLSEGGADISVTQVSARRVEEEIALLLERADISEELTRFRSHIEQMQAFLFQTDPQGRRLDFLLQEMAREINTIGAKSQDSAVAHAVIELKAEIERMREQVQNVE